MCTIILYFLIFSLRLCSDRILFGKLERVLQSKSKISCDQTSNFFELVQDYDFQQFLVKTEDGYFLRVFRVRSINLANSSHLPKKPLLFIHGILDSSDCWAIGDTPPIKSFLDKDYDIWLMNSRGNKYSCCHASYDESSAEFWDFSFETMAQFDLPAVVQYIYNITFEKIVIVGHSQGTTQTFAYLSENSQTNFYIREFHAIAPVVYMTGLKESDLTFYLPIKNALSLSENMGIYQISDFKLNNSWFTETFLKIFCSGGYIVCDFFISRLIDKNPSRIDRKQMRKILERVPARTSIKSIQHYLQLIFNFDGYLRKFDFGEEQNLYIYSQKKPPIYDISKIDVPVVIYYGDNDIVCSLENVKMIGQSLKNLKTIFYEGWGHLTYFWGIERRKFNNDLFENIEKGFETKITIQSNVSNFNFENKSHVSLEKKSKIMR